MLLRTPTRRSRPIVALLAIIACAAACASESESASPAAKKPDAAVGDGSLPDAQVCEKNTCAKLGAKCGSAPDGCGGVLACGACPEGQFCGGGGPNLCGTTPCTPQSCEQLKASCGMTSDGCESVLSCGKCTPPDSCGGGGVPNQCGCKPTTCAAEGRECGPLADGCGGTLQCGDCSGNAACEGGQCVPAGTGGAGGAGGSGATGGSGGSGGVVAHAGPKYPAGMFRDGLAGLLGTGKDYCYFESGDHFVSCGFTQTDYDTAPQYPVSTLLIPGTGSCKCPLTKYYGLCRDSATPAAAVISLKDGYCVLSSGDHLVQCGYAQADYDEAPMKSLTELGPELGTCVCE